MEEDIPSTSLADMLISETSTELPLLFTLPQELLDIMYHELWKLTPRADLNVVLHGRMQCITIQYGCYEVSTSSDGQLSGLPLWLLSNKAFLNDGLRQLFRRATWTAGDYWYLDSGCPKANHRNILAGVGAATNLNIKMDISNASLISTCGLFDPNEALEDKLNYFRHYDQYKMLLHKEMPDVKSLEIEMKCPKITVLGKGEYALDLDCFEPRIYPMHLDRFCIKLHLQDGFKTALNAQRFREVLRPVIEKAMLHIGPALVGKNYRLDIDEHLPAILLSAKNKQTEERGANDNMFVTWTMLRNDKVAADSK